MDERRQALVNAMDLLRRDLEDILHHSAQVFLNLDPDGVIQASLVALQRSLAHEASLGYYPDEVR